MIIADTNIVSTFARVDSLPLLVKVLEVDRLHITSATYHELRKAVEVGCTFLTPVLDAIPTGGELVLVELAEPESVAVKEMPNSLGAGEVREALN